MRYSLYPISILFHVGETALAFKLYISLFTVYSVALHFLLLYLAADDSILCLGLGLGFIAVQKLLNFKSTNSALHQIAEAPSVRVSGLRSLLSDDSNHAKLVIVRGIVKAKSAVEGNFHFLRNDVFSARADDVFVQLKQSYIYAERNFMGWTYKLPARWIEGKAVFEAMAPFVIAEAGRWPQSEYVNVNMDGSSHPLPLETVQSVLQPVNAASLTFLQKLFCQQSPGWLLQEEKILPLGKDVTAVGICTSIRGTLEIKSCNFLPYFLSEMTKDQMILELTFKREVLLWSGVLFGSVAFGVLTYAAGRYTRNWNRTQPRNGAGAATDEDIGDV